EDSRPVRIGNAASNQFQLDVYGEVMSSMYHAQQAGIEIEETDWAMQKALMKFLESHWREPDEGIWEVRGGAKHFTHSKMMAWLAVHRGVQLIEEAGLPANGEFERWKKIRDQVHREVCQRGYNPKVKAFTQYYGSDALGLFERPLALQNALGLLSEEYDPREKRLLGNFPQAFTHVALIAAAQFLEEKE